MYRPPRHKMTPHHEHVLPGHIPGVAAHYTQEPKILKAAEHVEHEVHHNVELLEHLLDYIHQHQIDHHVAQQVQQILHNAQHVSDHVMANIELLEQDVGQAYTPARPRRPYRR